MSISKVATKALKAQIGRWRELSARGVKRGPANLSVEKSPLCKLFYEDYCHNCPVKTATGETNCVNTPFESAAFITKEWKRVVTGDLKNSSQGVWAKSFRKYAKREVKFLEGLLE